MIRISFILADCGLCKKFAKTARRMMLHYSRPMQNIPSGIMEGMQELDCHGRASNREVTSNKLSCHPM